MAKKKAKALKVVKFSPETKLHVGTLMERVLDVVEDFYVNSKEFISIAEVVGTLELAKQQFIDENRE